MRARARLFAQRIIFQFACLLLFACFMLCMYNFCTDEGGKDLFSNAVEGAMERGDNCIIIAVGEGTGCWFPLICLPIQRAWVALEIVPRLG